MKKEPKLTYLSTKTTIHLERKKKVGKKQSHETKIQLVDVGQLPVMPVERK